MVIVTGKGLNQLTLLTQATAEGRRRVHGNRGNGIGGTRERGSAKDSADKGKSSTPGLLLLSLGTDDNNLLNPLKPV